MSRRTQRALAALSTAAMGSVLLAACLAANQPVAEPSRTFSTDVVATPGMPPIGPNAVAINGFAFAPRTLTVTAGSTVTWTNEDEDPHTVVADGQAFRSGVLGQGGTYSFTFPTAGTYDYVCSIHPFMHGSVVVTS